MHGFLSQLLVFPRKCPLISKATNINTFYHDRIFSLDHFLRIIQSNERGGARSEGVNEDNFGSSEPNGDINHKLVARDH